MIGLPEGLPTGLLETDGRVLYFPVRHHSPTAARLVRDFIVQHRPATVLVEGPAEFNPLLGQLELPHRLPVAIFLSANLGDGSRHRSFYPLCEYSPEWQAISAGRDCGCDVRFIDLSPAELHVAGCEVAGENRYADAELGTAGYLRAVVDTLGLPDHHALWDLLVEVEPALGLDEYLRRVHALCFAMRVCGGEPDRANLVRETAMARQVLRALEEGPGGRVLVVTGGYHSAGIHSLVAGGLPCLDPDPPPAEAVARFASLIPFSYQRLDGLEGYNAGMPSPGFYHLAWEEPLDPVGLMLREVVSGVRERRQQLSTADLIVASSMAEGLARLRGHPRVWRRDLLDGLRSALLKDDDRGNDHPMIRIMLDLFRGSLVGRLAPGTHLPALAREILSVLEGLGAAEAGEKVVVRADLLDPRGRETSRLCHRLAILEIPGVVLADGPDFVARDNLQSLVEEWRIVRTPEGDGSAIEASAFGATLAEAARSRLAEELAGTPDSADAAARVLIRAALAGFDDLGERVSGLVRSRVAGARNFVDVCQALAALEYLFSHDEALGTAGSSAYGSLLCEAWDRALVLSLDLGSADAKPPTLEGLATIQQVLRRIPEARDTRRAEAVEILSEVNADPAKSPEVRGACTGILWELGVVESAGLASRSRYFGDPSTIGRWLHGLFCTARETVLRLPELLGVIDDVLMGWDECEFLTAVPSLRLAFSPFTPREKFDLAGQLLAPGEAGALAPDMLLPAAAETMIASRTAEAAALTLLAHHGIRGGVA